MKVLQYQPTKNPELNNPKLNTQIMDSIEYSVCHYRSVLPDGWRCIVKMQDAKDQRPYYTLDLQSDHGGGDYAPIKMQMLEMFPNIAATGGSTLTEFCQFIHEKVPSNVAQPILSKLERIDRLTELNQDYWTMLSHYGLTHWYGGIRIPYNILTTREQSVKNRQGEIRIAFSGAKEWEDTFFAFRTLRDIQKILKTLWPTDQIWYNLRHLKQDCHLGIWLNLLDIREAYPLQKAPHFIE